MNFCISADELRRALAAIEAAEKNGFMHCLAVFEMSTVGSMLSDCRATYSDLVERAHPTDRNFDYGRFQMVSQRFRFVSATGTLVPIEPDKANVS